MTSWSRRLHRDAGRVSSKNLPASLYIFTYTFTSAPSPHIYTRTYSVYTHTYIYPHILSKFHAPRPRRRSHPPPAMAFSARNTASFFLLDMRRGTLAKLLGPTVASPTRDWQEPEIPHQLRPAASPCLGAVGPATAVLFLALSLTAQQPTWPAGGVRTRRTSSR